jgi:hypothetical protein
VSNKKFIDHALKILSLVLNYKWKWKSTFTSWLKVFMEFNCMAISNFNDWMFGILRTLYHFSLNIKLCFIKIFLIEFTLTSSSLLNKSYTIVFKTNYIYWKDLNICYLLIMYFNITYWIYIRSFFKFCQSWSQYGTKTFFIKYNYI